MSKCSFIAIPYRWDLDVRAKIITRICTKIEIMQQHYEKIAKEVTNK
jgi:hypothetical protein